MDLRVKKNFLSRIIFSAYAREFYARTCEHDLEPMYGKPRVNEKVERGSTFTFARDLPYIDTILFRA